MPSNTTNAKTLYIGDERMSAIVEMADHILTSRGDSLSAAFRRMCEQIVREQTDVETSLSPDSLLSTTRQPRLPNL